MFNLCASLIWHTGAHLFWSDFRFPIENDERQDADENAVQCECVCLVAERGRSSKPVCRMKTIHRAVHQYARHSVTSNNAGDVYIIYYYAIVHWQQADRECSAAATGILIYIYICKNVHYVRNPQ